MTPPRAAALLLAATLAACGDGGTNPPPTPTIAIAVAPASLNITAGSNDQAGITLTRGGGYTGAVSLALEGTPAGVTGTFTPASIGTGSTSSTLSPAVGASTAAGTYTLTVRATGSGVTAAAATLNLTVAPAPSFSLTLTPATLNIAQGASGNSTVNINRTNYLGPVSFTLEGAPAGITGSFNPNPSQANSTALTVTVANTVAAGNYTITVKANSPGQAEQTATVTLSIQSAGAGTVTWTFCSQSGTPTWAAYQNGTGGAWTQAVGAGTTFSFNITDTRGGIAWVELNGAKAELTIIYGSVAELQNNSPSCRGNGTTKTVNATMANLQPTQSSMVTLGGAAKSVNVLTQANFAIEGVPDGTIDLFATNYTQTFSQVSQTLNGIILRRNFQPAASSTLVPTLDWNGAEKITPVTRNLTVTNGGGELQAVVTYQTANGTGALLGFISGAAPYSFYGMPEASRAAGDLHILTVSTSPQNPYAYQSVSRIFAAADNQTVTLGSPPPVASFTAAATVPYLRPRITFTNLAEYNRFILMYWANERGNQSSASVQIWEGYGQPLAVDYTLPDFSTVAGWSNAWGLQSGVGNTAGGYNVTGWTTGGGVGLPPSAAGTTSSTAGGFQDNIQDNISPSAASRQ